MELMQARPISKTGFSTLGYVLPRPSGSPSTSEDSGRLLFLHGTWGIPESAFALDATIAVGPDGGAEGSISWRPKRSPAPTGIEEVRGSVAGGSVQLDGVKSARGLACDQYRITLAGDEHSGTFQGRSWAFGTWQGRRGAICVLAANECVADRRDYAFFNSQPLHWSFALSGLSRRRQSLTERSLKNSRRARAHVDVALWMGVAASRRRPRKPNASRRSRISAGLQAFTCRGRACEDSSRSAKVLRIDYDKRNV